MYLPSVNYTLVSWRRLLRGMFLIVGVTILGVILMRGENHGSERTLWVIDNSLSMAVTDLSTSGGIMLSRLDVAKKIVSTVSQQIPGEQGIMTAAYGAKLELPMTDDRSVFSDVIHGLNILERGGGSSLSTPLDTVRLIYGNTSHLHIIWITDGELTDSGATFSGFTDRPDITFIGVGSRSGGPIPLGYDASGRIRYKESRGVTVKSIRDDAVLQSVADNLHAKLILLESDRFPDFQDIMSAYTYPSLGISPFAIFAVFIILVGLMIPPYRYHSL